MWCVTIPISSHIYQCTVVHSFLIRKSNGVNIYLIGKPNVRTFHYMYGISVPNDVWLLCLYRYANSSLIKYMEKHKVKPDSKVFLLVGSSLPDWEVRTLVQLSPISHGIVQLFLLFRRKRNQWMVGQIKYFSFEMLSVTFSLIFSLIISSGEKELNSKTVLMPMIFANST